MIKIAPSILAADFAYMGDAVKLMEECGADYIHLDIMDGHFVPNITYGQDMVRAIRKRTSLILDAHLMVENPERYISEFVDAGADIITIHQESTPHVYRAIQMIKESGVKAGVALNPSTPVEMLSPYMEDIDLVLIMTVNPGFGGQTFIEPMLKKIEKLRDLKKYYGWTAEIQVDGGINSATSILVREAGAEVIVAGSAVFKAEDPCAVIEMLRGSNKK